MKERPSISKKCQEREIPSDMNRKMFVHICKPGIKASSASKAASWIFSSRLYSAFFFRRNGALLICGPSQRSLSTTKSDAGVSPDAKKKVKKAASTSKIFESVNAGGVTEDDHILKDLLLAENVYQTMREYCTKQLLLIDTARRKYIDKGTDGSSGKVVKRMPKYRGRKPGEVLLPPTNAEHLAKESVGDRKKKSLEASALLNMSLLKFTALGKNVGREVKQTRKKKVSEVEEDDEDLS
jgi:hypothetical protein